MTAINNLANHPYAILTPRGNTAIFYALFIAKQAGKTKVLIPDQGGWLTFKTYPKMLGMNMKMIKTDDGLIEHVPVAEDAVLVYTQPAGYFAEQDMKKIYQQCKGKTMVIADVSGSIGSEMCNGAYADILVGSFGEWKPINIGYGGFISAKEKKLWVLGKGMFTTCKVPQIVEKEVAERITHLDERYKTFYTTALKIKRDLNAYNILHQDKKGLNVVVAYSNDKEKEEIMGYCKKNDLEYTLCPRYIRVNRTAISIEVKRL